MKLLKSIKLENINIKCKPRIVGVDAHWDRLTDFNYHFSSSKVYGVVSKPGNGAWALSYLLAGRVKQDSGYVFANKGSMLIQAQLKQSSCYVGDIIYRRNRFGMKYYPTVRQLLEEDPKMKEEAIRSVVEELELSTSRMDRPLHQISNERWNATVAIGLAQGKSIFCFPYLNNDWKEQLSVRLETCGKVLRRNQSIMIIPSDSDSFISDVMDEMIVLEDQ
ncbi:hypothetical protein [Paenibacillus sp. YIM B09110]|uniref:hypothetical protein n=1 Tax=Paenibacillus sp. YIM B09110 TaxID=3126102 RepID=UPI00301CB750